MTREEVQISVERMSVVGDVRAFHCLVMFRRSLGNMVAFPRSKVATFQVTLSCCWFHRWSGRENIRILRAYSGHFDPDGNTPAPGNPSLRTAFSNCQSIEA